VKIVQSPLADVYIIEPLVHVDERGYFFESYRSDIFEKEIREIEFIQSNESKSSKGTLRGLHYQLNPRAQSKLVRVIEGSMFDVVVDIRKESTNFGKWFGLELSGENKKQLFIPQGFAHGFLVLSETVLVQYQVDEYYSKENDRGIKFDDSDISIDWPDVDSEILLSDKDQQQPAFKDAEVFA